MIKRRISAALPLAALAAMAMAVTAQANTPLTVTNTDDAGPGTLRQAITDANATAGADAISIATTGTVTLASDLPAISEDLAITGPGASAFTVDGAGAFHPFTILSSTPANTAVTITGLTVTNGVASLASGDPDGGAVENFGDLTLDHVTVSGSTATYGGGIATQSNATLTLTSSTVSGNSADGESGGGIYIAGTATVRDSTISDNSAIGCSFGGGIEVGGGGGVSASLTMSGSTVSGNSVAGCKEAGAVGGGIDEQRGSDMTISTSTISDNQSGYTAGGMRVGGTASVFRSTFSGNTAIFFAGGIGVSSYFETQPGDLTLVDSTVSGNASSGTGGGLGNFNKATLINDTIASNSAVEGGANVANDLNEQNNGFNGGISFESTIVADPQLGAPVSPVAALGRLAATVSNCENEAASTSFTSNGFNLESDAADATLGTPPTCGFTQSTDQAGADPLLDPLADNGGPTQTRRLLPGSPALDAGTSAGLTDLNPAAGVDQRGLARPIDLPGVANAPGGDGSDIGAFELAPPSAVTGPASNVQAGSATISGTAGNPAAANGEAYFEFDPAAGSRTPSQVVAAGASGAGLTADLTGLQPLTTYRYRIVVINTDGRADGEYLTFRTGAPVSAQSTSALTVVTGPANTIRAKSAVLTGTVNPGGASAAYRFQYGRTTRYGSSTPVREAGAGNAAAPHEAPVARLRPATTYHFRIVATNAAGQVAGADRTFRTPAATPLAVTHSATGVGATKARIHGTVDPRGARTTFRFEFGRTTRYGLRTGARSAGKATGSRAFSAALPGLRPGTLYHFRIVASNARGRAVGRDRTFRTPGPPRFTG